MEEYKKLDDNLEYCLKDGFIYLRFKEDVILDKTFSEKEFIISGTDKPKHIKNSKNELISLELHAHKSVKEEK